MQVLENYFLVLSAMEDNLREFKRLQDGLSEVGVVFTSPLLRLVKTD